MDLLFDLWPVYAGMLGAAALHAIFAYGMHATRAGGRPCFTAIACGLLAALPFALALRAGFGLATAIAAGLLAAVLLALGFGAATRRMPPARGLLASLALVLALQAVARAAPGWQGLVLPLSPLPPELGMGVALVLGLLFRGLHHAWPGVAARVLRQDPRLAACMGMEAGRIRLLGDLAGGLAGGIGGVMLALSQGVVSGDGDGLALLFAVSAASVLGGVRHWTGPMVGAAAVLVLARLGEAMAPGLGGLAVALAMLAMLLVHPEGLTAPLLPLLARLPRRAARWRPQRPAHHHRVDR